MPRSPLREDGLGELLTRAMGGDEAAYRRFLTEISTVLKPFVMRWTRSGSASDVDDLLQEVLIAVHQKRHTWRQGEPVMPWLYAIAKYKSIDAHRRRKRHGSVDIGDLAETLDDPTTVPNAVAYDVARAVASLTGRQREVVSAISVEGHSIEETARRFGMTNGAVRVAFHRGLSAITETFGRR